MKLSQKEEDKYHRNHLHVESKMWSNEPIYKTETDSHTQRTDLWLPGGGRAGSEIDWEFGVDGCKLLRLEWISNEVLLYSIGNYIQPIGIEHDGR